MPRLAAGLMVLGLVLVGAALVDRFGPSAAAGSRADRDEIVDPPSPSTSAPASPTTSPPSTQPSTSPTSTVLSLNVAYPKSGPGTFVYATTTGPVLGTTGAIRKFHVAMESNITQVEMADFTTKIDQTLGDPRSWIAGGAYRLQQVPKSTDAQFTVYLVTEQTSVRMCAPLQTGGYTSCRQGAHVVLNLDRWMASVTSYVNADVPLDTYRTYMINHEVGHALGNSHQLCPGNGKPAPVMEQQTFGLHGCVPNPWPYIDGKLYKGPPGRY
ncbi:MAG TPA: DUF3152 domain-containing protein [Micromonosporaceae bacterium]|nr:DUF3152 domain-containing protein [Micromonosporaceae bacterium]